MMMRFTLTKNNLDTLLSKLKNLDFTKLWRVEVNEFKHNRSVEQNKRLWKLYSAIGDYLGYTPEEMHELLKYKFLSEEKEIKNEKVVHIRSTATLNTEEMAEYQKQIQWWASDYGFQFIDE